MTSEAQILKRCKTRAKDLGLRPLRIAMRPGVESGWPDLFVFGPNKNLLGAETKRPGKEPTPLQLERGKTMAMFGFAWAKIDSLDDADFTLLNFARHCIGERLLSRTEWEAMQIGKVTKH